MIAFPTLAWGQFNHIITVPPDPLPTSLSNSTQLNLIDFGVIPQQYNVGQADGSNSDIEVNIHGGTVNYLFRAYHGAVVNVTGGSIDRQFYAYDGSTVNISGGMIGEEYNAFNGSVTNISGGIIGDEFDANNGSVVNISGGTIGRLFETRGNSIVNISGGTFGPEFGALPNSQLGFYGVSFLLNGAPITGLNQPGDSVSVTTRDGGILSVVLRDGSQREFVLNSDIVPGSDYFHRDAIITLTKSTSFVPEPGGFFGALLTITWILWNRRRAAEQAE
jgi:hypothetical protein